MCKFYRFGDTETGIYSHPVDTESGETTIGQYVCYLTMQSFFLQRTFPVTLTPQTDNVIDRHEIDFTRRKYYLYS